MTTLPSPASGPLPFQNTVTELPLPAALERLFVAKATGLLTLEARQGKHVVYVRDGYPVSVELPGSFELLGKVLVEMKFLDDKTMQETLSSAPPPGILYGEMLLERRLITEDQLRQALKAQVRRKLHRLFFLTDATIRYAAGEHQEGLQRNESLRVHPWRATYHGVRSAWNADRLRQALSGLSGKKVRTRLSAEELARFGLGADDGRVAALLRDQAYTLEALTSTSGLPIQPVSALLYSLFIASALEDDAPPLVQALPPAGARSVTSSTKPGFDASGALAAANTTSAPAPAPITLSPAAIELARVVEERLPTIESDDLFKVLGVARDATSDQIKTAYLDGARRFHPDRLASQGLVHLKPQVEKIFRRLSAAQATLLDEERRKEYLASLDKPAPSAEDAAAHQQVLTVLQAELAFKRGQHLLKKNELASALRDFEAAYKANPDEGEHIIYLAWTRRCLSQLSIADARTEINRGLKLQPRCASGHYYLGMLLKDEDAAEAAISSFRKAVALDARQTEAEQELRVLELRRARSTEKRGFFDRFRKPGK